MQKINAKDVPPRDRESTKELAFNYQRYTITESCGSTATEQMVPLAGSGWQ
jgi:hypothetical protein